MFFLIYIRLSEGFGNGVFLGKNMRNLHCQGVRVLNVLGLVVTLKGIRLVYFPQTRYGRRNAKIVEAG